MGEPVPRVNVVPFLAGQQESDARSGHGGLSSVPHARPRRGPPQSSKDTPGGPMGSWFPSSLLGDILQQRAPPPSKSLSPPGCLESVRSEKAQPQPGSVPPSRKTDRFAFNGGARISHPGQEPTLPSRVLGHAALSCGVATFFLFSYLRGFSKSLRSSLRPPGSGRPGGVESLVA